MQNAQQAAAIQALIGGAGADGADFEGRAKQGQLTFRATIKALQSGCDCESCGLLREALSVMMGEEVQKGEAGAQGDSSKPAAVRSIS